MKLVHKTVVLARLENKYGTWLTPQPSDGLVVSKMQITPVRTEVLDRGLITGNLGSQRKLLAKEHVEINFSVEFTGAGIAGNSPHWGKLLRACGWSETLNVGKSAEYSPTDEVFQSLSIAYVVDGTVHKARGCRGTAEIDFCVASVPTMAFRFMGLIEGIEEKTVASPSLPDYPLPILPSTQSTPELKFGEYNLLLQSLRISQGSQLEFTEFIGHQEVQIQDRQIMGEATLQAPALTDKDFFTALRTRLLEVFILRHGSKEGERLRIDAPKTQLVDLRYGDSEGIVTLNASLSFTVENGRDELKITAY